MIGREPKTMHFTHALVVSLILWMPGEKLCAATPLSFSSPGLSLSINSDAVIRAALDVETGRDYTIHSGPMCSVILDGRLVLADQMTPTDAGLEFTFGRSNVTVTLQVEPTPIGISITVVHVEGSPSELRFIGLSTKRADELLAGRVLRFGNRYLGLIPGSPAIRIASSRNNPRGLSASLVSGLPNHPKEHSWTGKRAVLFACSFLELGNRIREIEDTLGILPGMRGKYNDANRQSYIFAIGFDHSNIDLIIDFARQGGFGSILLVDAIHPFRGSGSNVSLRRYPQGESQLKGVVERIHQAGMLAGAHVFSTKVFQNGDFVAPTVEPGLYQDRILKLSQDIGPTDERITTTTVPIDWPTQSGHKDLLIGGEVVTYSTVSTSPPYGFVGCQRGRYGTRPRAHQSGVQVGHLVTDESRQIFLLDQGARLFAQFADRIATTYERVGFDWIYFDGAEDVQEPQWYTTAMGQWATLQRLVARPPVIVQAAAEGSFSWHLITRTGQRDYLQSTDLKKEIDVTVARSIPRARQALMPAEIGWFRLSYPNGHYASIDEIEYLFTKALAVNAAVSLRLTPRDLESLPHRGPLLAIMRQLEELRLERHFSPDVRRRVRQPGRDHMLVRTLNGDFALPVSRPIHLPANIGGSIRAFAAEAVGKERVTSVWNTGSKVWLEIPEPAGGLRATDYQGNPVALQRHDDGMVRMLVDTRLYLVARNDWRPEETFAQARISRD